MIIPTPPELKKNDVVMFTNVSTGVFGEEYLGSIALVTGDYYEYSFVKNGDEGFVVLPHEVEILERPVYEYQEGDIVMLLNCPVVDCEYIGSVGVVKYAKLYNPYIAIKARDDYRLHLMLPNEIELLEEASHD